MKIAKTVMASAALALACAPALAQVAMPYVPPELYPERRWLRGNEITFCIWGVSPTVEIDRRIAEEIGNALLLDVKFYEYNNTIPLQQDDFWEQMFIQLGQHCDAVMGFALEAEISADWLIPSRAYYEAPYVLAVTKPEYGSLGDIPPGLPVAATMLSPVDDGLVEYMSLQPKDRRWIRYPMPSNAPIIQFLLDGRVEGALIWGPLLQKLTDGNYEEQGISIVSLDPVNASATPIGMMMREYNVFLRDQIDQAIAALAADGIIDQIVADTGMPGGASTQ